MTGLTEEEKAKVELQVKALVLKEDFTAKKAAYTKVHEKLNRLIAEAENRRKGYDRAIARTAKDAVFGTNCTLLCQNSINISSRM